MKLFAAIPPRPPRHSAVRRHPKGVPGARWSAAEKLTLLPALFPASA